MVYAVVMCLFVCSSHADIASEWLNVESQKQPLTIAQGLYFSHAKDFGKIRIESPPLGVLNAYEVG